MFNEVAKYWTGGSRGYEKCVNAQFRNRRSVQFWRRLLAKGLGSGESRRVLDVGAGPGFFSILLAGMGHRVTAVDASPGMVEVAAGNIARHNLQVNLYHGDAASLDREKNNTFDAVVCRDVVWTLPDPEKAYAEWWRVLKPGGRLVVFDANYHYRPYTLYRKIWRLLAWPLVLLSEKRVPKIKRNQELIGKLPFVSVLRPREDKKVLKAAGFKIIEITENIYAGERMMLERMKYGHQGTKFMIVAEKPVSARSDNGAGGAKAKPGSESKKRRR